MAINYKSSKKDQMKVRGGDYIMSPEKKSHIGKRLKRGAETYMSQRKSAHQDRLDRIKKREAQMALYEKKKKRAKKKAVKSTTDKIATLP